MLRRNLGPVGTKEQPVSDQDHLIYEPMVPRDSENFSDI